MMEINKVVLIALVSLMILGFSESCPTPTIQTEKVSEDCAYSDPSLQPSQIGNYVTVTNSYLYSNVSISPYIPLQIKSISVNGVLYPTAYFNGLQTGVTYTLTGTDSCGSSSVNVTFSVGFSYTLVQAPCYGTLPTLFVQTDINPVLIHNQNSGVGTTLSNTDASTTGIQLSNGETTLQIGQSDGSLYCTITVEALMTALNVPKYYVIPENCMDPGNGEIVVTNSEDYTSLQVVDQAAPLFAVKSGNSVNALMSFGQLASSTYNLIASSQLCGTQSLSVYVPLQNPTIALAVDASCPFYTQVNATIDGFPDQGSVTWTYLSNTVTNPISISAVSRNGAISYSVPVGVNTCTNSRYMQMPTYLLPVRHEVVNNALYDCGTNSIVKVQLYFLSDKLNASTLTVYDSNNQPVTIDSDNTISIAYNSEYYLEDYLCFTDSDSYLINIPLPVPITKYTVSGTFFANESVYIPNYLDFTQLYVIDPTNKQQVNSTNGYFSLSRMFSTYQLSYQFRECSSVKVVSINFNSTIVGDPKATVTTNITSIPLCSDYFGNVEFTLSYEGLGLLDTETSQFQPGQALLLMFFVGGTTITYPWNPPSTFEQVTYSVTITNASCIYGQDGAFSVDGLTVSPSLMMIDDTILKGTSGSGLTYGYHTLYMEFSTDKCTPITTQIFIGAVNTYTLEYTITDVTDCSGSPSGVITIPNYSSFNTIYVINVLRSLNDPSLSSQVVNDQLIYPNLQGGPYTIIFTNQECGTTPGVFSVLVDNPAVPVTANVISQPTCTFDEVNVGTGVPNPDGQVFFQVEGLEISRIYSIDFATIAQGYNTITGQSYYWAFGGTNQYWVSTESCSWKVNVVAPVSSPNFVSDLLLVSCWDGDSLNYIEVKTSNPNVAAINVVDINGDGGDDSTHLTPTRAIVNVLSYQTFPMSTNIYWNNGACKTTISINVTIPTFEPSITQNYQCGEYDGNFQAVGNDDFELQIYLNAPGGATFYYFDQNNQAANSIGFSSNGLGLYYFHYQTNCGGEGYLYDASFPLYISNAPSVKVTNESCSGSNDGVATFTPQDDDAYYQISQYGTASSGPPTLLRAINPNADTGIKPATNNLYEYTGLIDNVQYSYRQGSLKNPACVMQWNNYIVSYSEEPVLTPSITDQTCDASLQVSVSMDPRISNYTLSSNGSPLDVTEPGTYPVALTIDNDRCQRQITTDLVVASLPSFDSSSCESTAPKKSKTGLIVGLVVGIIGALIIGGGIALFFFLRKKKNANPKVLERKITMKTVGIFTSGKVQQIDDF